MVALPHALALVLAAAAIGLPAQKKSHAIGALGTAVELDASWKRQKFHETSAPISSSARSHAGC